MDADIYKDYPVNQFEEDNILRELNKCLLAFRQNSTEPILASCPKSRCLRPNKISSWKDNGVSKEHQDDAAQQRYV